MFDGTANQEPEFKECPSCEGAGGYNIGDPEDGVIGLCAECDGLGLAVDFDDFVPERDAFTPND